MLMAVYPVALAPKVNVVHNESQSSQLEAHMTVDNPGDYATCCVIAHAKCFTNNSS